MNQKSAAFIIGGLLILLILEVGIAFYLWRPVVDNNISTGNIKTTDNFPSPSITPQPKLAKEPALFHSIPVDYHVYQTFNNCGPATLAMVLNYWRADTNQQNLGLEMRPYQNALGINDDKSVFAHEFITFSNKYGFEALTRPNGTLEILKKFIQNDFPVVVRTWLHPNEDIGHFRIVRGFNESNKTILQNDSYEGKDITYAYDIFLSMWQPFNYGYIVVYPMEKQELVSEILGEELNEKIAWEKSITRAASEGSSPYSLFNQSVAYYYLEQYDKSVALFEQAEKELPSRMLWYQLEPILALQKTGNFDRTLSLINQILANGNGGFAELYFIRGEVYSSLGKKNLAKTDFEKAYYYNSNLIAAKEKADALSL